jgi:hypothetical protein
MPFIHFTYLLRGKSHFEMASEPIKSRGGGAQNLPYPLTKIAQACDPGFLRRLTFHE